MSNQIRFVPLDPSHFPLLLRWLRAPHVHRWYDQGLLWTMERIDKKYGTYVHGYKLSRGVPKPMHAYVIYQGHLSIGYIQWYNPYDFPRNPPLVGLPIPLATFDFMIGDPNLVGKGLGAQVLCQFFGSLSPHAPSSPMVFVDPQGDNYAAIRCYEKVGFRSVERFQEVVWMLWDRSSAGFS